jgi:regulator of cell morphogenesis and NO signaling
MIQLDRTKTVAGIVLDHPATARIFKEHRIDFCCRGDVTVDAVSAQKGLDAEKLYAALEGVIAERAGDAPQVDPRTLSTAALTARIVDRHHGYLRRILPYLVPLATKVARVHGDKEARLVDLRNDVIELHDALLPHLDQEEEVLFPALVSRTPDRAVIDRELASMHTEHLAVGALLERIRDLTDDFTAPSWACNSYRTLFAELRDLEADVLEHVHLENHALVPLATRPR